MKPHSTTAAVLTALAFLAGGEIPAQAQTPDLDPATKTKIESAVTDAVHRFFGGMSTATCENVEPIASFEREGTIYVMTDEVATLSSEDVKDGTKYLTCNWIKHEGTLDSVLVDVLAPNAATAAWTYRETVTQKDGVVRKTKGAVLQVWVDTSGGWKIAATKSTEHPQTKE